MRVIETKVYKIDEHPNKEKCFEWIRNNWHDLNEDSLYDVFASLNALSKLIGGKVDYSISTVPARGEYITFKEYDKSILKGIKYEDCPLTGLCWDYNVIKGLQEGDSELVLRELHEDTEHQYSDEALLGMCQANEYEFEENGTIV
jgi:hypothetical protein